jgi:hypothetical protein
LILRNSRLAFYVGMPVKIVTYPVNGASLRFRWANLQECV